MSKITGVLVDDHIYDIKNDMVSGYCFPNSLFPGATFKMVIDNDPANNDKVKWSCSTNADDDILAISQDGTVTFPDVDETCIGKIFVIFATDIITNKPAGIYIFIVKRFLNTALRFIIQLKTFHRGLKAWADNFRHRLMSIVALIVLMKPILSIEKLTQGFTRNGAT